MSSTMVPPADAPSSDGQAPPDDELIRSGKDAAGTRRALVRAARRRFATEGYRAATVRNIAADAGVNVSLISRYFGSKEGLFEACMNRTADELDPQVSSEPADVEAVIARIVAHVIDAPNADDPLQLLLLLRSSGDDNADAIRRRTLESFTEGLARRAGWRAGDAATEHLLLNAQIAIATTLGVVMLRASTDVRPMATATAEELTAPLSRVLRSLLAGPGVACADGRDPATQAFR